MQTEKLELGGSCHLEVVRYQAESCLPEVSLEYVEHACDHYSSDVHTSITIDSEMARKIIAFLTSAHDL